MLKYRLILGPVMIAGLIAAFWLDGRLDHTGLPSPLNSWFERDTWPPGTVVFVVVVMLNIVAARELALMLRAKGIMASIRVSTVAALLGLVVSGLVPEDASGVRAAGAVAVCAVAVLVGSIVFYSRHHTLEGVMSLSGGAALAFVYLGLMLGFILLIRREHSEWTLFWVLLATKSCDIGAYFSGRAFGKRKLIPWLSPGKTWEGLWGGLVVSALVGAVGAWMLAEWDGSGLSVWAGAFLGALFGLVGQLGDLLASALKRDAGQKDSGSALPGFGGAIDVLDSPLLVAPVAYWMLAYVA